MKHLTLVLAMIALAANCAIAQSPELDLSEVYPDNYTFAKAEDFQAKGEYEKAVWFYVNLFPNNKEEAVRAVQTLALKLDTVDMALFIKRSFAMYGSLDPSITTIDNGVLNMDMQNLKLKGAWGDELIGRISAPDHSPGSASEYNFRGLDKANAGDFRGAIEDFDQATEIEPTGQIYYNKAYSKSMIEDLEGAIQDYDRVIELEYRLAEAHFERGYCKDQLNDADGAIADYTIAIAINSDYADAYNNRAFIQLKQNEYAMAINDLDRAIEIRPDFAEAYVSRGFARRELGNRTGACEDWNKAIELGYAEASQFLKENCE